MRILNFYMGKNTPEPEMSSQEEQHLLRSLDEATRDIDADKGVSIDAIRKRVGS